MYLTLNGDVTYHENMTQTFVYMLRNGHDPNDFLKEGGKVNDKPMSKEKKQEISKAIADAVTIVAIDKGLKGEFDNV